MVYNSGEDESDAKYLEIAQRSQKLLSLLEEKTGAFVMDAYNYQTVDDEGTPLYTMNTPEVPIEIAPAGMSIQVSREYFKWNPIETEDGLELEKQLVLDDLTLNLLVPNQYRDMEGFEIIELPKCKYIMFQGEPFEEADFGEAIEQIWDAVKKYNPQPSGYCWDKENPRIQLEPIGSRGYIELHPVKSLT